MFPQFDWVFPTLKSLFCVNIFYTCFTLAITAIGVYISFKPLRFQVTEISCLKTFLTQFEFSLVLLKEFLQENNSDTS